MNTRIVSLLAGLPESELRAMRDGTSAEIERLRIELLQVDEALTKQGRRGGRGGGTRAGGTREQTLAALSNSPAGLRAGEVVTAVTSQGGGTSAGSIRTTLARLLKEAAITRTPDGLYQVASQNGSAAADLSGDAPLLRASTPQQPG